MKQLAALACVLALAAVLVSQPAPRESVGPVPGGGFLLNSGAVITPAGRQIPLDTFPMSTIMSVDGKYMLVLNGGYKPPSIIVLDAKSLAEVSRVPVPDAWLGMAFSPNGRLLYVGGGSRAAVYEFSFSPEGKLAPTRTFPLVAEADRKPEDFTGDVKLSPDGRLLYAAMIHRDTVAVINPQSGMVIERFKTGRRPYRILFHPDGKSFFVTSWADGTLYHHNADDGRRLGSVALGPHTTDIVWRDKKTLNEEGEELPYKARIFVTASNTNSVYVVGVGESNSLRRIETINVTLTPRMPFGMTPSALALSPDQDQLYVVCSDANAAAVVDVSSARSFVRGFIPTAWYPTAARVLNDNRLVILNGRGLRSFANPQGPNPARVGGSPVHMGIRTDQYVGVLQTGTASLIDPFNDEQLDRWTRTVRANSPYNDRKLDTAHEMNSVVPQRSGDKSPIEHVIYIVKENRTYDQVLGDLGVGNGDPSLTLFKEEVSPNHHKLAREFVLLDNFYVSADVSADGHNWSLGAIAPDYVQKMWPNSYAGRRKKYDYEGGEPAAIPPAGYIWNNVLARGLTMRNYGYFANNRPKAAESGEQIDGVRDAALAAVTNREYRAFDLDYPDVKRAQVFIDDLKRMETNNNVPRFMIVRLGNDHTSGTSPGKIAPLSAMADNDQALGMIVQAVSASKIWPTTAIFVLEDDAQNGPDHVDSHRSPAFVISPYVRRGAIDSTMYNTVSMLRTMELILGLRPMTAWDAGARVMAAAFSNTPDTKPYTAVKANIPLDQRNPTASPTAARSLRLNFEEADMIDDDELNDILWRALKGSEPPAPVASAFGGR